MSDTIKAPFSAEQVDNLNKFQRSGAFHPFTGKGKPRPTMRLKPSAHKFYLGYDVAVIDEILEMYEKPEIDAIMAGDNTFRATFRDIDVEVSVRHVEVITSDTQRSRGACPDGECLLTATTDGWVCPCGEYRQFWAHAAMADPKFASYDPRSKKPNRDEDI